MTTEPAVFRALDDEALLVATKQVARDEQRATATLLRALGEVDRRRLYLADGCASLFTWCTQVLHLSEGGAYNRIEVARAARAYPLMPPPALPADTPRIDCIAARIERRPAAAAEAAAARPTLTWFQRLPSR